jgi:hypothetical protein
MAGPKPPMPAGPPGIGLENQRQFDLLTEPLAPLEMWLQSVQAKRGFESTRSGDPGDELRKQAATIPHGAAPGDKGTVVGKGYETFAGIQVLDKDGRRVAYGADRYPGGGHVDNHAEAKIVRGLEKNGPAYVPGGRLIVVVEKDCCPSCEARLRAYAQKRGLKLIEIYLPEREDLRINGRMVSSKRAAITSFQNLEKKTKIELKRSIELPHTPLPGMGTGTQARTAVIGCLANLAAGAALGIVQDKMKEWIRRDLEGMPKPRVDRREAAAFFSDPATARAIRLLDLMDKHLDDFGRELDAHHAEVIAETGMELRLLALSRFPDDRRLEFLTGLQDQLSDYQRDLLVVNDNLEAAKAVGTKAIESAKGAEQLASLVERALIADWLLQQGFKIDEIVKLYSNLVHYSDRVRRIFKEVDERYAQVQRLLQEEEELASQVNKIYWGIILGRVAEDQKRLLRE